MADDTENDQVETTYEGEGGDYDGDTKVTRKFTHDAWKAIEEPVSHFTKLVFDVLRELAIGGNAEKLLTYSVIGEEFYLQIRPLLEKFKLGRLAPVRDVSQEEDDDEDDDDDDTKDTTDKKKKEKKKDGKLKNQKKKKGMSAEEIRMSSTISKMTALCEKVLGTFQKEKMNYVYGLENCDYLELRGVIFMYCAWFMTQNQREKFKKEAQREDVYELIVAIQKFLFSCSGLTGKYVLDASKQCKISKTMLKDLTFWLNELETFCPFDGIKLYKLVPRLLVFTNYDGAIPSIGITPRKSQIDLVTTIKEYKDLGFFLSLKAMVSTGKTTAAAVCIPTMLNEMNTTGTQKKELIFCCNINAVRSDVARIAYHAGIKFGIASIGGNGSVKIINHFNTTDETRVLIIADPASACILLALEERRSKVHGDDNRYWVFLDEPTTGADQEGSISLHENMSLLPFLPKHSILSSATLCELDKIPSIVSNIKAKYPGIYVGTIYSSEIQIGCDLKTFGQDIVVPFAGCKTSDELTNIIKTIKSDPFLGRLCTTNVTIQLWSQMNAHGISGLPDIKTQFKNAATATMDRVRVVCMELLTILSQQSNNVIADICKTKIIASDHNINKKAMAEVVSKKKDDSDIFFEDDTIEVPNEVTFEMIGTHQAYKFMQPTLIVDVDPLTFAQKNFKGILDKLKSLGADNADALYKQYEVDCKKFQATFERLDKRVKDDIDRSQQKQGLEEDHSPKIKFPACCQINTISHIKEFAKGHTKEINPRTVRPELVLEMIPFHELHVPDWVVLLLFAGVGIIDPSNSALSERYNELIEAMGANGKLAFIVSNKSIAFGTNWPFFRVFVTKQFTENCSIFTLFQLLGRAGRVGQSWSAEAFIDANAALTILQYAKDPSNCSVALIEPRNMETMFKQIIAQIDQKKEQKRKAQAIPKIDKEIMTSGNVVSLSEVKQRSAIVFVKHSRIEISQQPIQPIQPIQPVRPIVERVDDFNRREHGNKFPQVTHPVRSIEDDFKRRAPIPSILNKTDVVEQRVHSTPSKADNEFDWRRRDPSTSSGSSGSSGSSESSESSGNSRDHGTRTNSTYQGQQQRQPNQSGQSGQSGQNQTNTTGKYIPPHLRKQTH